MEGKKKGHQKSKVGKKAVKKEQNPTDSKDSNMQHKDEEDGSNYNRRSKVKVSKKV